MNIFEEKIVSFFDSISNLEQSILTKLYPQYYEDNNLKNNNNKSKIGIIFDYSFDIFKDICKFLEENINTDKNKNNKNLKLAKLYSLVYIKYYLYNLVYIIKEHKSEIKNIEKIKEIFDVIKNTSSEFSYVLKIYIFKLFYHFMNSNYEEFKYFKFEENFIDFSQEFDLEADNNFLTYLFLPLDEDDYNNYLKESNLFEIYRNNNFLTDTKELANMIKDFGLDNFICISINKIISNLGNKNYLINNSEFFNFSSFIKTLFTGEYILNDNLKKLIYTLYDGDTFQGRIRNILKKEGDGINNQNLFEIILYGFRFSLNILDNKTNETDEGIYLYKSLLTNNYFEAIKNSYIPGIDNVEDYHLISLEDIENHMKYLDRRDGCYVCSCGFYYHISPCGLPIRSTLIKCCICGKDIGYPQKLKMMKKVHIC